MNKRIVIDEATALQVASLAQSRVLKVTKPQGDQSIVLDLSDQSVKLDFSAIADEKMTFMQAGARLVILFDNMSRVTADPFFDFSGKAISNFNVELGGGRAANGEQFAQLFPITDDQSGQRTSGNIPASGANFRDVSIDSLPGAPSPLALLHGEQLKNAATDVDRSSVGHFNALTPTPVVTIPSPGGPATMVFEAGLGVRNGEPAGTHAGQPSFPTTTKSRHDEFYLGGWSSVCITGRPYAECYGTDVSGWVHGITDGLLHIQCGDGKRHDQLQLHAARQNLGHPEREFCSVGDRCGRAWQSAGQSRHQYH
jgi:hypothetical protein